MGLPVTQLRVGRALLGGLSGLLVSFAFSIGASLRACLPDRPEMILFLTFEFLIYGIIFVGPVILIGVIIGYFSPPKVLIASAIVLSAATFATGYAIANGNCVPI